MREGRLEGEFALVTGGTAGIGRAVAERFAREGAVVALAGRNRIRGETIVEAVRAGGGRALFRPTDLADEADCTALVDWVVEELGELTVLVNAAVAGPPEVHDGSVHDLRTADWERLLRVNLTAAMWLCRAAIGAMLDAGRGAIVNISSRAASRGVPGSAGSSASKAGLEALTRSIAVDHARDGIRCNAITTGEVIDPHRDRDLPAAHRARLEAMHLTGPPTTDDLAAAAVFLASREAGAITGITLPVDGGAGIARAATLG